MLQILFYSRKFETKLPTKFLVLTSLRIAINRRLLFFIVHDFFTIELFLKRENNPKGLNLATRVSDETI